MSELCSFVEHACHHACWKDAPPREDVHIVKPSAEAKAYTWHCDVIRNAAGSLSLYRCRLLIHLSHLLASAGIVCPYCAAVSWRF